MNKGSLLFQIGFFYAFAATALAQNVVVNDTYTAQQLVENVLLNSSCATSANYAVSGDTFSGSNSYGYFSYSGSTFPFADGIVLSTSRASRTQGPNNDLIDEGNTSWMGDPDLEQALNISGTYNATVLEFDFTPATDQISFDYLFASEEYHGNALCRYSDGFAFLLKPVGSAAPYQNLALIPNTNIPVKVTSVHPAVSGTNGCAAENEAYFGGFNGSNYPINFDGQTTVMTARATVTPGVTYHIKLVIADEANIRYDSAIFLKGGSFNVGVDLGPDRLLATNNPLCTGQTLVLDATLSGTNTYQWFKNGLPIGNATNATYTVTDAGIYSVEVTVNASTCIATGEVIIEYAPLFVLNDQTLVQCDPDNDGITTFNLSLLNALVTGGIPNLPNFSYFENLADAQAFDNPIIDLNAYQSTDGQQVYAGAVNTFGCSATAVITLSISNNSVTTPAPIEKCDDAQPDGLTAFDLGLEVTPILTAGLPSALAVAYYATQNDALTQTNPLPDNFTNTTPLQQTIYAQILNGADCYDIVPVVLRVLVFNPAQLQDETRYLCNSSPINLSISNIYNGYLWSTGATSNSISVTQTGNYSVTVTNAAGCTKTKVYTVIAAQSPVITGVQVNDFDGLNNTIEIIVPPDPDYAFSLDGVNYQPSPLFTHVAPGLYTAYIRNPCGIKTKPVTVLDYPRFFTPNGDGINDSWSIKNLQTLPYSKVTIFDRFGKLVYSFNEKQQGWNGRTGQNELPATDYWFVLEFYDRESVKGHFSLKR